MAIFRTVIFYCVSRDRHYPILAKSRACKILYCTDIDNNRIYHFKFYSSTLILEKLQDYISNSIYLKLSNQSIHLHQL